MIWNLLHNAIRFSGEHGTITLSCRRVDDEVVLEVSDDGAGIPARLLPRIFDSFERFDETLGGMGLGLSIAKSIVEAHGGSINAGSAGRGRGATFQVRLPAASAAASAGAAARAERANGDDGANIAGLRVLVVEDHHDSAVMLLPCCNPQAVVPRPRRPWSRRWGLTESPCHG